MSIDEIIVNETTSPTSGFLSGPIFKEDFYRQEPIKSYKVCMKKDLGLNGTLFGGNLMSWIDEFAYIAANVKTAHRNNFVTRQMGDINFDIPVREGNIVEFNADNFEIRNTSISFDILVTTGQNVICETYVIFVAVDKDFKPTSILK
jgi:acyl-CoA hydrolase